MDLVASQGMRVTRTEVNDLLPTPKARDYSAEGYEAGLRRSTPQVGTIVKGIAEKDERVLLGATERWGKFQPAIERWEKVFGRPAPAPTKPDGRNETHRLNSQFTEWMMGLPEGWVTNAGLSRTEELKACGNGVVPQQAELALSILLRDTGFIKGEQNENM